jgi:hypothetical protein
MTTATLKRRLIELENHRDQDNELEVLQLMLNRFKEAGGNLDDDPRMDGYQEPGNADKMTIGELTLHALRWKHRDTK